MQLERFTARVLKHLPNKPYCSNDKTARLIRTQRYALKEPYIQLNPPSMCAWLIFDIDEPFQGEYAWERHNLPVPNYIAFSRDSRKYHMSYAISPVCTTENAREKPLAYLAAIHRTYKRLLNSDAGFAHLITKNPMHSDWLVTVFHDHEYSLAELHDGCGDLDKRCYDNPVELADYERNVSLFRALRYHAYAVVHHFDSHKTFHAHLECKIDELNAQFSEPLSFNEIMCIAKSVSKWTWRNRSKIRSRERKMQLDASQPLETRQSMGAHYTNAKRTESVLSKAKAAYQALILDNKKPTQKAVQELSGLGIATIKRHWKSIK